MSRPDLISGETFHGRRGGIENAFRYKVDYLAIDPEAAADQPRLFSRNRRNLTSLWDRDHGGAPGAGEGAQWAREVLAAHGLAEVTSGQLTLIAQPRVLGHVFNPVSFWLAHDANGALRAVIAEVTNTFRDRHSYLCAHSDQRPITRSDLLTAQKIFHVSPFQPIEGGYKFRFDIRVDRIGIWIDYSGDGTGLFATLTGPRKPLSDGAILAACLRRPFGVAPGAGPDPLAGGKALVERREVSRATDTAQQGSQPVRLPGYGLFAAMLAAAGLPIYLHAPAYYAAEYGIGLTALAGVLFVLRLLDVVQDPALGWLSGRLVRYRGLAVAMAVALMGGAMLGLFAVAPPLAPLAWFAAMLLVLFSAYSFLTITFYARGVAKASELGSGGHLRVAAWRETGALIGVSAAAVAPTLLTGTAYPYANFALVFAAFCAVAWAVMRAEWHGGAELAPPGLSDFAAILRDPVARRLLIVGLANAAPVAVSASLFLFFVEDVLAAADWAGPLLLVFFLAAASGAPLWARLAQRIGARRALTIAMILNIAAFAPVPWLSAGDAPVFAVICVISGLCVGADATLLPALFARRMSVVAPTGAAGFGLWSFVSKFTLALAAIVLLPALDAAGFVAGGESPENALRLLAVMYAGLPCVLKLVALAFLWAGPLGQETRHA